MTAAAIGTCPDCQRWQTECSCRVVDRASILEAARDCVTRDRNGTYGEPEDSFAAVAAMWDALDRARGNRPREACDVALYLQALKSVRASSNPGHIDSWIDGCGYGACGGELAAARAAREAEA